MDKLEQVEKLRERADVSYEEAARALEEAGGDLLDALVILEKEGKMKAPEQSAGREPEQSAGPEEQKEDVIVESQVIGTEQTCRQKKRHFAGLRNAVRKFCRILRDNSLIVSRNKKECVRLPLWLLAIVLLITGLWKPAIIVMIISLFFQVRYSLGGKDQLSEANEFMEKAGNAAEHIKEEFRSGAEA